MASASYLSLDHLRFPCTSVQGVSRTHLSKKPERDALAFLLLFLEYSARATKILLHHSAHAIHTTTGGHR